MKDKITQMVKDSYKNGLTNELINIYYFYVAPEKGVMVQEKTDTFGEQRVTMKPIGIDISPNVMSFHAGTLAKQTFYTEFYNWFKSLPGEDLNALMDEADNS